jgi:hypothetical protein
MSTAHPVVRLSIQPDPLVERRIWQEQRDAWARKMERINADPRSKDPGWFYWHVQDVWCRCDEFDAFAARGYR